MPPEAPGPHHRDWSSLLRLIRLRPPDSASSPRRTAKCRHPPPACCCRRAVESTVDGSPLEGWNPRPVTGLEQRKSRRPLLLIATGSASALPTGAKWLVDVPARHADDMRNDLAVATTQLGRRLPGLVAALGPITNPEVGTERLVATSGLLVDLGSARGRSRSKRPVPCPGRRLSRRPSPPTPSWLLDDAARLAVATDRIEQRLGAALGYRSGLRHAFVLHVLWSRHLHATSVRSRLGWRRLAPTPVRSSPRFPATRARRPPTGGEETARILRGVAGALFGRTARRRTRPGSRIGGEAADQSNGLAPGSRRATAPAGSMGGATIIRTRSGATGAGPPDSSTLDLSASHLLFLQLGQLSLEVGGVPETLVNAGEPQVGHLVEHP